jgi:hypothetical protein
MLKLRVRRNQKKVFMIDLPGEMVSIYHQKSTPEDVRFHLLIPPGAPQGNEKNGDFLGNCSGGYQFSSFSGEITNL